MKGGDEKTERLIRKLEGLTAEGRIGWALEKFGEKAISTSSIGAESAVLLHLIKQVSPEIPIYFINTGFLFPETVSYKDRLEERLGINIRELFPLQSKEDFLAENGELYKTDSDGCCWLNKVQVLEQALEGVDCWINGLRRDQSVRRADTDVVEIRLNGLHKLHPIFDWSREKISRYMKEHKLPLHPLVAQGYASIGCQPCTQAVRPGEDQRNGRWQGQEKTECGLHTWDPAALEIPGKKPPVTTAGKE